jgi:hypothetical protein
VKGSSRLAERRWRAVDAAQVLEDLERSFATPLGESRARGLLHAVEGPGRWTSHRARLVQPACSLPPREGRLGWGETNGHTVPGAQYQRRPDPPTLSLPRKGGGDQ